MNLEEYLKEYKALTLDMMERINIDGEIEYLFNERQQILDEINSEKYDKNEIKDIGKALNLLKLEEELILMMKKEKVNTRKKLEKLRKMHDANMKYNAVGYVNSRFNKES